MEWKEFWSDPQLVLSVVTILLSVISIVIAILSSRSTSKAAAMQIESLKQLVEKQGQEIEEIKNLSSLLVKSDIENLNTEILRLNTELSGMGYEICLFEENERNPWIRSLAGDKTTMKDKDQYEILKNKRDLLFKLIRTLQERKVKLEKGTKE